MSGVTTAAYNAQFERAVRAEAETDRLRETLRALATYLATPHRDLGKPCGADVCILCLAESVVHEALSA